MFDEPAHLITGYVLWKHHEVPMPPENGVFAQRWAALPLALQPLSFPDPQAPEIRGQDPWVVAYHFFHSVGNPFPAMLLEARAMIALLGVALGWLVFACSRHLFGVGGALLSLTLFAFSPALLAHGGVVTTDVALTLMLFAATLALWRVTSVVSATTLLASTLAVALLVITKMSFFVIFPIAALLLVARTASSQPVQLELGGTLREVSGGSRVGVWLVVALLHVLAVIALLWLAYDFNASPDLRPASHSGVMSWLLDVLRQSQLFPRPFLQGLGLQLALALERRSFFLGEYSLHGWKTFFPVCFLVKTPLGTLLLLLLAPLAHWYGGRASRSAVPDDAFFKRPSWFELTPLFVLLGVYGGVCIASPLNLGNRHMLPMYPALFVLSGAHASWLRVKVPWTRVLVFGLTASTCIATMSIRPHYLSFFNSLIGGPRNGYKYFVDSTLDWGQDLPTLATWLHEHVPKDSETPVYFSYFGTGSPKFYGIEAQRLPGYFERRRPDELPELAAGTYAISATMLQGVYQKFPGPWSVAFETLYVESRAVMEQWESTASDPVARAALLHAKGATYFDEYRHGLDELSFARLCAYLRTRRTPDDYVGYSILIYELNDADLKAALIDAPVQLVDSSPLMPTAH